MEKIILSGNKGKDKFAIVDDDNFEYLSQFNWYFNRDGYAISNMSGKTTLMHRLIDKTPTEFKIDHINGNRLDNRKINIRRCTVKQNSQNRNTTSQNQSGIKGVTFCNDHQRKKPWAAKIENNGRTKFLGYYSTKEEAGVAYNAEAKKLFGDFAYLNTC